jgi:UDP-N-acetylmuramyl pentapeptide synthase
LEGVAKAKGELFDSLKKDSLALINLSDPYIAPLYNSFKGKKVTFGKKGSNADLMLLDVKESSCSLSSFALNNAANLNNSDNSDKTINSDNTNNLNNTNNLYKTNTPNQLSNISQELIFSGPLLKGEEKRLSVPFGGIHNAENVLTATAISLSLDIPWETIESAMCAFSLPEGRGRIIEMDGVSLINDSYNANPGSMEASLNFLKTLSGKKGAILGDMLELGKCEKEEHFSLGERAAALGLEFLAFVGPLSISSLEGAVKTKLISKDKIKHFLDPMEAVKWAWSQSDKGYFLLVKGSHSIGLDKAIREFLRTNN